MAIHPHTRTKSLWKSGILTVSRSAYGEADVQPSLLPVHSTTGFPLCQGHFMRNFRYLYPIVNTKLGFIDLLVVLDQLPTTVSLRGGFCRRGNLPVLLSETFAVKIEVSAKMCHTLNFFVIQRYTRRLPRRFAPRNDSGGRYRVAPF